MRTGLALGEAQRLVLEETPLLPEETLGLRDALGRVLAEPIVSERTLPPHDNSAMDGYAVRTQALAAATPEHPVTLPVAFEVAAGGTSRRPLGPAEAARIFTGGVVPEGCDAVVRQEETERDGERVRFHSSPEKGENIRLAGEDVQVGDAVLDPGATLGPAAVGMLASLGRTVVAVHQRPRVAILSSGDELVEPDRSMAGGRIVSSNSYALAAQCREAGAQAVYLGIAADTPEALEARLAATSSCDVVVSSAGVSVGDRDYVRPVLERLGCELRFFGVRMRPGYPVAFGLFRSASGARRLVFGLPGNPVSALVTFEQFVRPALLRMSGRRSCFRPLLEARLTHRLDKKAGRLHLVRVTLRREGDEVLAAPTGSQGSGVLRSMVLAQGLLVFPAEAERLEEGARVRVQLLDEQFLARSEPSL